MIEQVIVRGLKNRLNSVESEYKVGVYPSGDCIFVVVTDINKGPSITNTVETACPQIAIELGLFWDKHIWIESYPVDHDLISRPWDASFDRICFHAPPDYPFPNGGVSYSFRLLPTVNLAKPQGWRPLTWDEAHALQAAGCTMSTHIGRVAIFRQGGQSEIVDYNGRIYRTLLGEVMPIDIVRIED